MADERQHREHRLDEHTALPLAPRTQLQSARIARRGMEAGITQDNHTLRTRPNQPLKCGIDVSTTRLSSGSDIQVMLAGNGGFATH